MQLTSLPPWVGVLVWLVVWAMPMPAVAQDPPKNLQYFDADIARGDLIQRMREFSFALDVRCQYCHAGGDGAHQREHEAAGHARSLGESAPRHRSSPSVLGRQMCGEVE